MKKTVLTILSLSIFYTCKDYESRDDLIQKAKIIHSNVITLDTHNDIDVKNFTDNLNYSQKTNSQVNLPKMIKGGLDVSWLIVYTGQGELNKEGYRKL